MQRTGGLTLLLALALATSCSSDETGDATTAEIHCETWISQNVGIPTDDLQFSHDPTESDQAPSYSVTGNVVGGEQTQTYQCDTTFDGTETWALDSLDLTPR